MAAVSKPSLPPWCGTDGEWLRHASWDSMLAQLPDAAVGRAALERLRDEFTPTWSLTASDHPVRVDNWWLGNRVGLLEMGHVLRTVRCGRVRDRLRDPKGYLGIRAELRAGALLLGLGARLTHEPRPLNRPRGLRPDWRVEWPDGELHVEVKLSHTSVQANAREVWSSLFSGELLSAIARDVLEGDGLWTTLRMREEFLDSFGRDFDDRGRIQRLARLAAGKLTALVRLRGKRGPVRGRFTLVPGCDVVLKPRVDGASGLSLDGHFFVSDEHRISLRLRTQLTEAAQQLDAMPGGRVILLDTSNDSALRSPASAVAALLSEAWADRIAAVLVVKRGFMTCIVEPVLGRALDADLVPRLLSRRLRLCARNHLHAEPHAVALPVNLAHCDAW